MDPPGCSRKICFCCKPVQQEVSSYKVARELEPVVSVGLGVRLLQFCVLCSLFVVTFLSFLLAFGHFASEVFIYGTADLSFGSIAPLLVSGETSNTAVIRSWVVIVPRFPPCMCK